MSLSAPQESRHAHQYDGLLLILLAVSLSLNAVMAYRMGRLDASSAQVGNRNASASLVLGSKVPPIEAQLVGGGREAIKYGERPTFLYVFSVNCQWCARNENNLKTLTQRIKNSHRVIGLSLDSDPTVVETYARTHGIDFPVYISASSEALAAYRLGATPHTLLIDTSGKLVQSWVGAYAGTVGQQVEEVFDTKLPGLLR